MVDQKKIFKLAVIAAMLFTLLGFSKVLYAQTGDKSKIRFWSPIAGKPVSSRFGRRVHPVTGKVRNHKGIDITVPIGTWVSAAADGKVTFTGSRLRHYGRAIYISHKNGYVTHYGHLSEIKVRVGQTVSAGQYIGKSGDSGIVTGPHLHFTLIENGKYVDPLDYIDFSQ
jgi:murein DD-endopeptidase MepM/ murein hydrolase activator NlpD